MKPPGSHAWDLLATYLGPQWPRVALLAALLFGGVALELINPQIVRGFIDTAQAGGAVRALVLAGILYIGIAALGQGVTLAETYVAETVGWVATNALRADLAERCMELDLAFHHRHTPGQLIERIDGDVTNLSNFFSRFVLRIVSNAVLLGGILLLLFREDWRLGTILALFALVALLTLGRLTRYGTEYSLARRRAKTDLIGFVEEHLSGIADVQVNGGQPHVMNGLYRHLAELLRRARAATLVSSVVGGAADLLLMLGTAIALGMGAYLYRVGNLTLGAVFLIFQYAILLRRPLEQITREAQDFQNAGASITRVRELYVTPRSVVDGRGEPIPAGPLSVELDDVSFSYNGSDPVLRDVSLRLAPGRVLGLLGRTGSGKTTLTRLLFRLYDPDRGAIRLGGVDLRDTRVGELRRRVGMVTQDVQLFRATVRENLTLFNRAIPDERVLHAIRVVGLGPWYEQLPSGLDSLLLGAGAGLSAGEAQLLAFARVFLQDPDLVILDEASSRIDPATERLIEHAVDLLLKNRTAVVIAHRLTTVRRADEIVILENGRVVERGERPRLAADPTSRFYRLLQAGAAEVLR